MFCSVTARYPASNSKHVLFGEKHVVYPHPLHAVNFLQFSDEKKTV